jgi:putative transposase
VKELSAIPQASREIALQRFELLRPYLEGARPLRTVASEGSIPDRTALRWVVGYRNDGLGALAGKGRTDQGTLQETERNVRQGEFSSPKPFVVSKI